jgi:pantothenate kinase
VQDGPTLTSSHNIDADAVDILNVKIDAGTTTDKVVDVQPGDSSEVMFICIKSNVHDDVKYMFTDSTGDSSQVILDKDHIITSTEVAKLFGKAPNQIKFINNSSTDAVIDIVVARKAIA